MIILQNVVSLEIIVDSGGVGIQRFHCVFKYTYVHTTYMDIHNAVRRSANNTLYGQGPVWTVWVCMSCMDSSHSAANK